jgi:hypothetical protein
MRPEPPRGVGIPSMKGVEKSLGLFAIELERGTRWDGPNPFARTVGRLIDRSGV